MPTIGEQLKNARKEKGLSINDIQKNTKIQKRYLEAIEMDNFDSLPGTPGTFYVRAFIRQYATAVGLDGDKLIRIYDGEDRILENERQLAPYRESVNGSRKSKYQENRGLAKFKRIIPVILLSLIALTIVGVTIYITFQDRKSNPIINTQESISVEASTEESTVASSQQTSSSTTTESTSESSEPVEKKMEITFDGESSGEVNMSVKEATDPITVEYQGVNGACWLGVLVNGTYVYEHTLNSGETVSTQLPAGTSEATLVLGASGNAQVKINGESLNFNPNQTGNVKKNIHLAIGYAE